MVKALTIVCGNAGVGKSTYGKRLAAAQQAAYFDSDTVSERLVRVGLCCAGMDADDRDSPRYKELYRDVIHEVLFDIALENLVHVPCVIVAPFTRERRCAEWPEQLASRLGVLPRIIVLHCEDSERRRRIAQRANPRDTDKLSSWQSYTAVGRDPTRPPFVHEWVDTTLLET